MLVGAMIMLFFGAASSAVANITRLLPLPTSPIITRRLAWSLFRSFLISSIAFSWSPVGTKGRLFSHSLMSFGLIFCAEKIVFLELSLRI